MKTAQGMTRSYWQAQQSSYPLLGKEIFIPTEKLDQVWEYYLGSQPLGCASKVLSPTQTLILLFAYFEPCIGKILATLENDGLHLHWDWIRGSMLGTESVRFFPSLPIPSGQFSRGQTVNFGPRGTMIVSRNIGNKLLIHYPIDNILPDAPNWALAGEIELKEAGLIHSVLLELDENEQRIVNFHTIEASDYQPDNGNWKQCLYDEDGRRWMPETLPPYRYGLGKREGVDGLFTITDFRTKERPGIYLGQKLIVPGVHGNGICFLADGSAFVTRYGCGAADPGNGKPGAILVIPQRIIEENLPRK